MNTPHQVHREETYVPPASLLRQALALRRRWKVAAYTFLLVAGLVTLWTLRQPRIYRPQAVLEVRPERTVVAPRDDQTMFADTQLWESFYRTQQNILSSPSLAEATIAQLPPNLRERFKGPEGIERFAANVDLEQVRSSFILKVGFPDADKDASALIANTLVSVYLEDANRRMRELKSTAADALTREALPDIRATVDAAEKSMSEFQASTGFVDFEERYRSALDAWKKASERHTEVRLTGFRLQAEHASVQAYVSGGAAGLYHPMFNQTRALEALGQQRAKVAEQIASESQRLKDGHPRMKELRAQLEIIDRQIEEAVKGTFLSLEASLKAAAAEESALAAEVKRLGEEMSGIAEPLNRSRRLDSELAAAKELYEDYLKRQGESAATANPGTQSVRVVEFAKTPVAPWKPDFKRNIAIGIGAGLLLGIFASLAARKLDDRIRSPEDVRAFVGTDVLATIPRLRRAWGRGVHVLNQHSMLDEVEAFRTLRAQVVTRLERLDPAPSGRAKVVAVTSPLVGEGKSTISTNLARVLAMEGRKVLLFDADLRKPRLHTLVESHDGPGLQEVLDGTAPIEAAIHPSRIEGVDVLGVRTGSLAAAELTSSTRFTEALQFARAEYDIVILDCAPVMQASESPLVARRADATIFVMRERQSGRGTSRAAAGRMEALDVNIIGAVLNDSEASLGYDYYGYAEKGALVREKSA